MRQMHAVCHLLLHANYSKEGTYARTMERDRALFTVALQDVYVGASGYRLRARGKNLQRNRDGCATFAIGATSNPESSLRGEVRLWTRENYRLPCIALGE